MSEEQTEAITREAQGRNADWWWRHILKRVERVERQNRYLQEQLASVVEDRVDPDDQEPQIASKPDERRARRDDGEPPKQGLLEELAAICRQLEIEHHTATHVLLWLPLEAHDRLCALLTELDGIPADRAPEPEERTARWLDGPAER